MDQSTESLDQTFCWDAHPARERAGRAVLGGIVILVLAWLAGSLMQSLWWGFFAAVVLLVSLNRFFFPSRFTIDGEGITARYPLRRQRLPLGRAAAVRGRRARRLPEHPRLAGRGSTRTRGCTSSSARSATPSCERIRAHLLGGRRLVGSLRQRLQHAFAVDPPGSGGADARAAAGRRLGLPPGGAAPSRRTPGVIVLEMTRPLELPRVPGHAVLRARWSGRSPGSRSYEQLPALRGIPRAARLDRVPLPAHRALRARVRAGESAAGRRRGSKLSTERRQGRSSTTTMHDADRSRQDQRHPRHRLRITTTKAILIEKVDGVYRQTHRGEAPTTVEEPFADVTMGVVNAVTEVAGARRAAARRRRRPDHPARRPATARAATSTSPPPAPAAACR